MARFSEDAASFLQAARAGSREALGEALEGCRHYLLRIAQGRLNRELQAKGGASDLVQETFLEAQRDFARFHGSSEAELLAWLRRLLLNNMANFGRRYCQTDKRQAEREVALGGDASSEAGSPQIPAKTPSPSGQAIAHEQAQALEQALQRLPADYRRVILLRNQERLPFDEIGKQMARSSEAARRLWSRAIERLQQELEATA
jgi:RNA polymerase sigma-70 factor (ECF subfamily)